MIPSNSHTLLLYLLSVAFGAYVILQLNLPYPFSAFTLIIFGYFAYWYAQKNRLIK